MEPAAAAAAAAATTATTTIRLSETKALDADDLERLRRHAAKVFDKLKEESRSEPPSSPPSWVLGDNDSNINSDNSNSNSNSNKDGEKITNEQSSSSFRKRYFDSNGFWIERGFCNTDETHELKRAMSDSVRRYWFPKGALTTTTNNTSHSTAEENESDRDQENEKAATTFATDVKSNAARGDPFLESADKVTYFAEPTALDSKTGALKPEFRNNSDENDNCENQTNSSSNNKKVHALCKAGHGLHLPPSFRRVAGTIASAKTEKGSNRSEDEKENNDDDDCIHDIHKPFFDYTTSAKLGELVLSLGYQDPVVPQSMYIFKNPVVGGAVHSHQDSTFLYTTPRQTCLGLWLALDDATLDNGCLWVRPKSHFEPLRRQFIRNPKYKNDGDGESKLAFRQHHDNPEVTWEGTLPESVEVENIDADADPNPSNSSDNDDNGMDNRNREQEISSLNFVPVEVRAGDLVVFGGTLDHFSLPNFSDRQRHTFQLHLVEGPGAGVAWSPENWLQYDETAAAVAKAVDTQNDDDDNDTNTTDKENKFLRLLDYETYTNKEIL
uniref:Uncharacterized protein n=1 Tax=Pseudo-nitzschia australis TaxID=44445 RepID=A0A7S4AGY4_9STRA